MKITSAVCVSAIKRSPLYAGLYILGVKRRSKRKVGSKVVRIFEVLLPRYDGGSVTSGGGSLYARVEEEDGQIAVYQTDAATAAREEAAPDEEQIDAERFQQMFKKEEPEQEEEDIDVARFKEIGR